MAGGAYKIGEYNKSLTPAERKASARRAGRASGKSRQTKSYIQAIARLINEAPPSEELRRELEQLNITDSDLTNAAAIALAVFKAARRGDMKAVEKWESYVGQTDHSGNGERVTVIIDV